MKFWIFCLLGLLMAMFAQHRIPATVDPSQIEAEMQKLKRLETSLAEGGIAGLLKTATSESIAAPKINSNYFAGRIAKQEPDLAPLEHAKRAFGLKVAKALDALATEALRQENSDQRIQLTTRYLDLADWLEVEKGYGNYLLVTRCENLAVVPLGYLIADLSFPMEKILAQRDRISTKGVSREFRRAVLNGEAPKPFIDPLSGTDSQQNEQMQIAWGQQWHRMRNWFKERNVTIDKWKQSDLPDDLAFFLEDCPAGPKRTSDSWEMNLHASVVNGYRSNMVESIDKFAKYRELVGSFPTEPPSWWKPDDPSYSRIGAAFQQAWRPFRREHGPLHDPASFVYERVQAGTWMDSESQLAKEAATQKP